MNRLRRSAHFVPGASEKMLNKSLDTAADGLILDLEDAVTPEHKDSARETVADWLAQVDFRGKERTVRMNPLDTPWGYKDLEITMRHPPDAYVVPKVSQLSDLTAISGALDHWERTYGHPLGQVKLILVATETPLGVLNLHTFTECERVVCLTWGAEDLSAALSAPRNRYPDGRYLEPYQYCRTRTLLCAAAGEVQPMDTVYTDIRNIDDLTRECQEAAWMGFTGKMTIHPDQIPVVNAAFTPSAEEVDTARRLLDAFKEAEAEGRMAFSFEGQMVDVPHLTRAQRLVERAEQISSAS